MSTPTVQVLLDNFLGAFPYDITTYADTGFSWERGRPDEFSTVSPGSLTLTLDNTDGRFTLGSATYGIGLNQKIRVKVNGTTRYTGRVQAWPVSWPGGDDSYSTVEVTAVDDLARCVRRTLRSSLEEEFLVDSPTAYYTLGEATGATQAADSSGNGMPPVTAAGTGTAFTFGNGTGPTDGLPAVQMAGGQYLAAASSSNYLGTSWSIEVWVNISTVPVGFGQALVGVVNSSGLGPNIVVNTSGQVVGAGVTGPNICDGLTHQVVATFDGATFSALYVDGVFIGSSGASLGSANKLSIGQAQTFTFPLVGTISHVATFPRDLLASRVASHWSAGHSDFLGETPQARLARVATYMGMTTASLDSAGGTLMGVAQQQGRSAADVIDDVSQATLGFAFVDASGAITSTNGYSVVADLTPDAIVDANWAAEETAPQADMFGVMNFVTGKATGSENVFYAGNAFSQAVHGIYPEDFTWNVSTDAQAQDRTNWLVNIYAGPQSRFPDVSMDVLTMSAGLTANMLTLEVGGFLRLTGMPSQSPGGATVDLIVQGLTETINDVGEWTVTATCTRHGLYAAWILGDALWGVLGTTTKLYAA